MSSSAAQTSEPAAADSEKTHTPISPMRWNDASFQRNIWEAIPVAETPFDAVLDPDYWMHVAKDLKQRDRIEVFCEDGSYWAELIVLNAGRLWAKVAVISHIDLTDSDKATIDDDRYAGYEINWGGPVHRFRVLKNGEVLFSKLHDKKAAQDWLENHVRNVTQDADRKAAKQAE